MAIQDKIDLETRFQLNATPNEKFRLQDLTDYASEGITPANVIGAFIIKNPLGTVIHSTVLPASDIDNSAQDYIDTIDLPTDSNGDVIKGTYEISYTIRVTGGVQDGDYEKTFLYDYCYEEIVPNINLEVDQLCSTLTSTDNTALPIQTTSTTLTHTITPPIGAQPAKAPQIVSTVVNTYSGITTKTWTSSISNIIELTFPASGTFSEHFIDVTVTGDDEVEIRDDLNRCSLKCNMEAMTTRYFSNLGTNSVNASKQFDEEIAPALLAAWNYESALVCGNFTEAQEHYDQVLKFTGSNRDCDCDSSAEPTLIIPTCVGGGGSGLTYVVDACGTNSAITVTSNQVNDEITFTVCFDDAIWTKINALTETDIISSDGSITIATSTNGYNKEYDLTVDPALLPHSFSGILSMDFTTRTAPPVLSWKTGWSTIVGDKLQEPGIVNSNPVMVDWTPNSICFYLENYIDQAGGEFPKPQMQIIEAIALAGVASKVPTTPCTTKRAANVFVSSIDEINDRIYFSIADVDGLVPTGQVMTDNMNTIDISVIINA